MNYSSIDHLAPYSINLLINWKKILVYYLSSSYKEAQREVRLDTHTHIGSEGCRSQHKKQLGAFTFSDSEKPKRLLPIGQIGQEGYTISLYPYFF
jgi:hypothetical protein